METTQISSNFATSLLSIINRHEKIIFSEEISGAGIRTQTSWDVEIECHHCCMRAAILEIQSFAKSHTRDPIL